MKKAKSNEGKRGRSQASFFVFLFPFLAVIFLFLKQHKSPFTTERDGSMISFIIYIA